MCAFLREWLTVCACVRLFVPSRLGQHEALFARLSVRLSHMCVLLLHKIHHDFQLS